MRQTRLGLILSNKQESCLRSCENSCNKCSTSVDEHSIKQAVQGVFRQIYITFYDIYVLCENLILRCMIWARDDNVKKVRKMMNLWFTDLHETHHRKNIISQWD